MASFVSYLGLSGFMSLVLRRAIATPHRFVGNPSPPDTWAESFIVLKDARDDWRARHYHWLAAMYTAFVTYVLFGCAGAVFWMNNPLKFFDSPTPLSLYWLPMETVATRWYWYYVIQTAFYGGSLLFTLDAEASPYLKDRRRMVFHHALTLALLIGSFAYGYHRIGVIVTVLHDVCDIFLFKAQKWHTVQKQYPGRYERYLAVVWACFVVSFAALRVVGLPYLVSTLLWHRDVLVNTDDVLVHHSSFVELFVYATQKLGIASPSVPLPGMLNPPRILAYLLVVLWGLQLTWFWNILRMTVRIVRKGGTSTATDVRE